MKPKLSDPVIDEIREVRRRISEKFDHDPAKLIAYYMQLQEKYKGRVIGVAAAPSTGDQTTNAPAA